MAAFLYSGIDYLILSIDTPYDNINDPLTLRDDLASVRVWYSTTQGFNPLNGEGTLAFNGLSLSITLKGLTPNTRYYVRYALVSAIDTTTYTLSNELTEVTDIEPVAGKTVSLAPTYNAFVYNAAGASPSPGSSTITASTFNFTSQTPYFEWYLDGVLVTDNNTNTLTYTPKSSYYSMPDTISVKVRDGNSMSPVVAEDSLVMFGVIAGSNAITIVNYNPAHSLFTSSAGVITYTGSGTAIQVLEGANYLTVDNSATPANGTFKVTAVGESGYITPSSTITIVGGTTLTYGNHSNMTQTTARIVYTITVKDSTGTIRNFISYQNFTQSIAGSKGDKGDRGDDGASIQGPTGLSGITNTVAYILRKQDAALLTVAPSITQGLVAPTNNPLASDNGNQISGTGWSLTPPEATVGTVIWYTFGRYNSNSGGVIDGIAAGYTVWSVPVAASVFQDIRSDNWTGAQPTLGSFTSATGYYLNKSEGSFYGTNVYLRGQFYSGLTNSSRISINQNLSFQNWLAGTNATSNKLAVINEYNEVVAWFGGRYTGSNEGVGIPLMHFRPSKYKTNYSIYIDDINPYYYFGETGLDSNIYTGFFRQGLRWGLQSNDSTLEPFPPIYTTIGNIGATGAITGMLSVHNEYYKSGLGLAHLIAAENSINVWNWESSGPGGAYYHGARFFLQAQPFPTGSNTTVADVYIARKTDLNSGSVTANVYAIDIVTGNLRYGGVTIATPPNNTTQYLRADGTWQAISSSYTLPLAANGTRGGVQIGYATTGRNYAVQLDANEKMYVNVPWTDTDTDTDTVTRLRGTTSGIYTAGDITLAAGSNVSIGQSGSTITISSSDTVGVTSITAAGGISGGTITTTGTISLSGTYTGTWAVTGAITATGEITAYSSDRRLKTNIEHILNPIDKIKQLNGVTYNWNNLATTYGFDPKSKQAGLLAQEVEAVLPEAVKLAPFDIDETGNSRSGESYKTIQYEKLIPLLIEAIKDQQKQIDQLKCLLEV